MNNLKLSTKIVIVSVFILLVFSLASFGILFRALSTQATLQMDQLLNNEALALSALVDINENNQFDFEMSTNFLSQFKQRNPQGFFRFSDPQSGQVLKESVRAPEIKCLESQSNTNFDIAGQTFRVETLVFQPERDDEANPNLVQPRQPLCLIVGTNQAPFRKVLLQTLLSSIPILILIVAILIIALLVLIRSLTKDLIALTSSLGTTDFNGTHAFPKLPQAHTQEVRAIIKVLEELHRQAAELYSEMWLFMGRAAHQIKTPVTAMKATVEVLLRKNRSKEELLVGLADVQAAVGLLNSLTEKLISSSRLAYEKSPLTQIIDLLIFFPELIEIFRAKAVVSGIKLVIETDLSMQIMANRTLMYDIFGNLIENALLYSPQHQNATISISWRAENKQTIITITDQGPGFPEAIKSDLFKPFIRGDERSIVGSGLGLSIVKKAVDNLGGDIQLTKSTTAGSTLQIYLPRI